MSPHRNPSAGAGLGAIQVRARSELPQRTAPATTSPSINGLRGAGQTVFVQGAHGAPFLEPQASGPLLTVCAEPVRRATPADRVPQCLGNGVPSSLVLGRSSWPDPTAIAGLGINGKGYVEACDRPYMDAMRRLHGARANPGARLQHRHSTHGASFRVWPSCHAVTASQSGPFDPSPAATDSGTSPASPCDSAGVSAKTRTNAGRKTVAASRSGVRGFFGRSVRRCHQRRETGPSGPGGLAHGRFVAANRGFPSSASSAARGAATLFGLSCR